MEIIREGTSILVRPGGNVVASIAGGLRQQIKGLLEEGVTDVTVDLAESEIVDSVGIGLLIAAHNSVEKKGGKLTVINASSDLRHLFQQMRLDRHFEVKGS